MDDQMAIDRLLAFMQTPTLPRDEVDEAIAHIRASPAVLRRVGHLVRALLIADEDQVTCEECQDELPEYLQAEAEGHATMPRWRPVELHLDLCPHCTEIYAELHLLAALAEGGQGIDPPDYPVLSLAFLQPPQPPKKSWHLDDLGRLIIVFSADLLRSMQPPPLLVGTKSASGSDTPREYVFTNEVDDLNVTVTIEPLKDDRTHCMITVDVDVPSRGGWPNLADIEVMLKHDETELDTCYTDAFGKAVFEDIATADLEHVVIEIGQDR